MRKKSIFLAGFFLAGALIFTGCEKELTKEEVEASGYYQDLQKENKDLQNNVESLEKEVNELSKEILELQEEEEKNSGNETAQKYFDKIINSSLLQIEVGYTDDYCDSVYINNSAICKFAKNMAKTADLTANYTPEKLREEMGAGYVYTLYEEDDSVFQAEVYSDGYVIFEDLPGQVYYCKGSTVLGQALLLRKGSYPNSNLLHRMADSSLVVKGKKKAWDQSKALEAANMINEMEKTKTSDKHESSTKTEVVFYSYGNRMILSIYKTQFSITAWDGEETWYAAEKEDVKELKTLFSK